MAKYEEFRLRREKEKQERLARIAQRKQELQDHRVVRTSSGPQLQMHVDGNKPNCLGKEIVHPQSHSPKIQATGVKPSVSQRRHDVPGSARKMSLMQEGVRRMTIASTRKKIYSENIRQKVLAAVNKENAVAGTTSKSNACVKRHLPMPSSESVKKPCLQQTANEKTIQEKKNKQKTKREDVSSRSPFLKPKNKNIPLRPYVGHVKRNVIQPLKESTERAMSRKKELELWRQKKSQQVVDESKNTKSQNAPRNLQMTVSSASNVQSSTVKNSAVRRTTIGANADRAEFPSTGRGNPVVVNVKPKFGSKSAILPSTARNIKPKENANSLSRSMQKVPSLAQKNVKNSTLSEEKMNTAGQTRDPTKVLETILSVPTTPENKGPRMSTPNSNRPKSRSSDLLQFSSIVGNKTKRFSTTWTPNASRRSALSLKLEKWLEEHGKTPTRYRHLSCHGVHAHEMSTPLPSSKHCVQNNLNVTFQKNAKQDREDAEAELIREQLIEVLTDGISLVHQACPTELLENWLQGVTAKIPDVKKLAHYWSLKAHIAASQEGGSTRAIEILEEGAKNDARPVEELEKAKVAISEIVARLATASNVTKSAMKRVANEVQTENIFESSSVKFSLKKAPILQPTYVTPQKMVITPVRRSTRKSCGRLPLGLRDHDVIVESIYEVPMETRPLTLFQSNVALNLRWSFEEPDEENK